MVYLGGVYIVCVRHSPSHLNPQPLYRCTLTTLKHVLCFPPISIYFAHHTLTLPPPLVNLFHLWFTPYHVHTPMFTLTYFQGSDVKSIGLDAFTDAVLRYVEESLKYEIFSVWREICVHTEK